MNQGKTCIAHSGYRENIFILIKGFLYLMTIAVSTSFSSSEDRTVSDGGIY